MGGVKNVDAWIAMRAAGPDYLRNHRRLHGITELNWRRIMSTFDLTPPTEAQRRQITAGLDGSERRVLLEHGTEAAFCGVFLDNKKDGVYTCRFCGLPLFRSNAKFDSGTGWPSFFRPYDEAHIERLRDTSYGMVRVEEVCARCGSHLGHVFPDGPPPTGERHCLNSVSMSFTETGKALPDVLGRGAPEGAPDAGADVS
jgi:peptide-methionine (R)-S-oxide reductase